MKKIAIMLASFMACVLFMGAGEANPPILPTKDFHINDYADIIDAGYREIMIKEARKLYELTGAQIVILTVADTSGIDIEQYASLIFNGWNIGGETHENGVLLIVDAGSEDTRILPGKSILPMLEDISDSLDRAGRQIKSKDYSNGIAACFFAVVNKIYEENGLPGAEGIAEMEKSGGSGITNRVNYAAAAGLGIIIMLRLWRVNLGVRKRSKNPGHSYLSSEFLRANTRTAPRDEGEDRPVGFSGRIVIKTREPYAEEKADGISGKNTEDDG